MNSAVTKLMSLKLDLVIYIFNAFRSSEENKRHRFFFFCTKIESWLGIVEKIDLRYW